MSPGFVVRPSVPPLLAAASSTAELESHRCCSRTTAPHPAAWWCRYPRRSSHAREDRACASPPPSDYDRPLRAWSASAFAPRRWSRGSDRRFNRNGSSSPARERGRNRRWRAATGAASFTSRRFLPRAPDGAFVHRPRIAGVCAAGGGAIGSSRPRVHLKLGVRVDVDDGQHRAAYGAGARAVPCRPRKGGTTMSDSTTADLSAVPESEAARSERKPDGLSSGRDRRVRCAVGAGASPRRR